MTTRKSKRKAFNLCSRNIPFSFVLFFFKQKTLNPQGITPVLFMASNRNFVTYHLHY